MKTRREIFGMLAAVPILTLERVLALAEYKQKALGI